MPHDLSLLGGHTPGSDEGSMTLHELTVLCTKLSNKVDNLETELKQTKQTYGAALTKLIKKVKKLEQTVKTSQARRRAKIVVSDDEESSEDPSKQGRMIEDIDQDVGISLVNLTKVSSQEDQSKDQLGVLSAAKVLTDAAKKNVNTYTRKRRVVSTGSEGVSTASRIFKYEDEANPPVADIDWDDVQAQIQADKDLAHKLLEEERENLSIEERARLLAELIDKRKKLQVAQRYEAIRNKPQTMSQQSQDHLMIIVPEEGMNVEALQTKYPIIDWEVCTEDSRMYWKIIRVGNHTELYQIFEAMLNNFNRDDLDKIWNLVKERFSSTDPTDDKERTLWVE
ncbi:hypothetical protein Tco_1033250 [Tanacetum coccineum]|uniref:Uncharacterized protein n=1 Tax=Tanacetum coccineum TaxID=301880 RepID=A0ABQ5GEW2_9ASTR